MAPEERQPDELRFALPTGRMQQGVLALLDEAGIRVRTAARSYRPVVSLDGLTAKFLKPQNIVEMLHSGSRDIGFAGADWVVELEADVVELVDTELDPVQLVAAAPRDLLVDRKLPNRPLVIASEYENLTRKWIGDQNIEATFIKAFGATEVFPPDDADCIVDNTATGSTLDANNLVIVDELMRSSTRLFASRRSIDDPVRRDRIETMVTLVQSVIEARKRVMVEVNVSEDQLESLIRVLPAMRQPTVSPLHHADGYAVKAAVCRKELPLVVPKLKAAGGTDIVVTKLSQIVP